MTYPVLFIGGDNDGKRLMLNSLPNSLEVEVLVSFHTMMRLQYRLEKLTSHGETYYFYVLADLPAGALYKALWNRYPSEIPTAENTRPQFTDNNPAGPLNRGSGV